jgi:predicted transcriptional regulator
MGKKSGLPVPGLKRARENRTKDGQPISRQMLADAVGLDASFIWRLETGGANAGYYTVRLIMEYLGVTDESELTDEPSGVLAA